MQYSKCNSTSPNKLMLMYVQNAWSFSNVVIIVENLVTVCWLLILKVYIKFAAPCTWLSVNPCIFLLCLTCLTVPYVSISLQWPFWKRVILLKYLLLFGSMEIAYSSHNNIIKVAPRLCRFIYNPCLSNSWNEHGDNYGHFPQR
jgi:hypothetical protein